MSCCNRKIKLLIFLTLVLTIVIFLFPTIKADAVKTNKTPSAPNNIEAEFVPGEILVTFKKEVAVGELKDLIRKNKTDNQYYKLALKNVKSIEKSNIPKVKKLILNYPDPETTKITVEKLKEDPDVISASLNYIYKTHKIPNDPFYTQQWHLNQNNDFDINAPEAWDSYTGLPTVITAIIDSGIYLNHPDIKEKLYVNEGEDGIDSNGFNKRSNGVDDDKNGYIDDWQGWDTTTCDYFDTMTGNCLAVKQRDNDPNDEVSGHGTHVAGIVAAATNNSLGVSGVNWGTKILPIKVLNPQGWGTCEDINAGLYYAAYMNAKVVNLSLGGDSLCEGMESALSYLIGRGGVVIAAAGNSNSTRENYPAALETVIAVGAIDNTGKKASFSSYGSWVDIVAPGLNILSTMIPGHSLSSSCGDQDGDGYGICSGTSMAAPVVSGVAGLIVSKNPGLNAIDVKNILANSAKDLYPSGKDIYTSWGLVNAQKALNDMNTTTPPLVQITSPISGQPFGSSVLIRGEITVPNFKYYKFDYASELEPNNWKTDGLSLLTDPTETQWIAASWDTSALPNQNYILRLTALTIDGLSYESSISILIDHTIYGKWPINTSSDDMVLDDLDHDNKMEIITQGQSLIIYNSMGEIVSNTSGLPIVDWGPTIGNPILNNNQREISTRYYWDSTDEFIVLTDPQGYMFPGWPTRPVPGTTRYNNVLADINADGLDEIINMECDINSNPWRLLLKARKGDGTTVAGFDQVVVDANLNMCYSPLAPVVSDLNNDSTKEIITEYYEGDFPYGVQKIVTFSHQGEKLWEYTIPSEYGQEVYSPMIVSGDITGNGLNEVIVLYGLEEPDYYGKLKLIVLNDRGVPIPPFMPLNVGINDLSAYLMLADFNGDGIADIFVNDDWWGAFAAFDGKGNALLPPQKPEGMRCKITSILDLDHDGKIDLISQCKNEDKWSPSYGQYAVNIFTYDSTQKKIIINASASKVFGNNSRPFFPIGADIDGDGVIELVTFVYYPINQEVYLYAYKTNFNKGNEEWVGVFGNSSRTLTYVRPILKKVDWLSSGFVDYLDVNTYRQSFGAQDCGYRGDIDYDCNIGIFDFSQILKNLGKQY
jgi:subtilisin family serine protease